MTTGRVGAGEVPVFGSASAGMRFELVVTGDEREDPFVSLDDSGRFARVLLGRIAIGDSTTLRLLAVKLQRNAYAPLQPALGQPELTNPELEALWRHERRKLLGTASPEIAELLDLGEHGFHQGPVTYCRRVGAYFHPPCPRCLGPLRDCRDDDRLRRSGLVTFSGSLARYLHCPTCAAAGVGSSTAGDDPEDVLYAYSPYSGERPEPRVAVHRRTELYRDYRKTLQALEGSNGSDDPRPPASFPCAACEHRAECYPAGASSDEPIPAEAQLVAVSYYETHVLPLEVPHLRLDEFSDLVSGRDWAEVRRLAVESKGSVGRARVLAGFDSRLSQGLKRIFRGEATARDAMESLWLKLSAFLQVCRGLERYQVHCGEPHLRLHPGAIMMALPAVGEDLPAEWSFQAKLWDLGGQRSLAGPLQGHVPLPPPECPKEYLSPLVTDPPAGHEEAARIAIRSHEIAGSGTRLHVEATTRTRLRAYLPGDVVRLLLSSPPDWLEASELWGEITRIDEATLGIAAYVPESTPPPGASFPLVLDGRVALYKRLGTPCDLHALGMLLFRLVLSHDELQFSEVEESLRRIVNQLVDSFPETEKESGVDPRKVIGQLEWQFEATGKLYSPDRLVVSRDGTSGAGEAIPRRLWLDLLTVGFRMLSTLPGFGYATQHADPLEQDSRPLVGAVMEDVARIRERLHVELFSRQGRDQEIRGICDEIIAEVTSQSIRVPDTRSGEAVAEPEEGGES
jgi:hypothetical protein